MEQPSQLLILLKERINFFHRVVVGWEVASISQMTNKWLKILPCIDQDRKMSKEQQ
jgi:hypothetical protein